MLQFYCIFHFDLYFILKFNLKIIFNIDFEAIMVININAKLPWGGDQYSTLVKIEKGLLKWIL